MRAALWWIQRLVERGPRRERDVRGAYEVLAAGGGGECTAGGVGSPQIRHVGVDWGVDVVDMVWYQ